MEATATLVKKPNVTVASILEHGDLSQDWIKEDLYFVALHTVLAMGVRLRESGALLVSQNQATMEKIRQKIFPPGRDYLFLIKEVNLKIEKSGIAKMEMFVNHELGIAFDNRFVREGSGYVTSFPIMMVDDETAEELIGNLASLDFS